MYTRAFAFCNGTCSPECMIIFWGIEDSYTIGIHRETLRTQLLVGDTPLSDDDLTYHFGLWFTEYGQRIVENTLAYDNCRPEETCNSECDGPSHARFWYGTDALPSPGHLDAPEPQSSKKRGEKRKCKEPARLVEITLAVDCDECRSNKTIAAAAECAVAEPAATDEPPADPAVSTPADPEALSRSTSMLVEAPPIDPNRPDTPSPSRLPTLRRPQTCFCDECLNPPTRYARLDDSDLEG
ncbi:uncharacterized protein LOC62_07G009480 [Vanrija pseudolonga]|uniref:Uncharacterized protein n=1 Tax=Vanrija pseudolonga TaxID=143232 RepID=A0AAF1BM87_9TREE|nr:hypothetical protein LOC62_07G009480 [Vanrija pseudolonga]